MLLRLFNPSHDECLSSGSPYFTPSLTAQAMDRVRLPHWHGLEDALPAWDDVERIEPWGWDARLVHLLRRRGCPERLLPSAEQLAAIRRLSSRETAVRLLPTVTERFESWWVSADQGLAAATALAEEREGRVLYKSPWSCSGRGVFAYNAKRISKVMRQMGGIEVEPLYPRVADFAMEFRCSGGEVVFAGLAAMLNGGPSERGVAYGGNLVADDAEILALMTRYVPEKEVMEARDRLLDVLRREVAPFYDGPLGVDQMIVGPPYALHPMVEINLRHTMGLVAIERREAPLHLPL